MWLKRGLGLQPSTPPPPLLDVYITGRAESMEGLDWPGQPTAIPGDFCSSAAANTCILRYFLQAPVNVFPFQCPGDYVMCWGLADEARLIIPSRRSVSSCALYLQSKVESIIISPDATGFKHNCERTGPHTIRVLFLLVFKLPKRERSRRFRITQQ